MCRSGASMETKRHPDIAPSLRATADHPGMPGAKSINAKDQNVLCTLGHALSFASALGTNGNDRVDCPVSTTTPALNEFRHLVSSKPLCRPNRTRPRDRAEADH